MRVSVRSLQQLAKQLVPSYVFHPRVETLEADLQGYNWTGCRLLEGVPRAVRDREALSIQERGATQCYSVEGV